jgi:hypothetical protein
MDESSFGGESSEPPSTGPEYDDPPGISGNTAVLTFAKEPAADSQNHGNVSILTLLRNAASPISASRPHPANSHAVAEKRDASPSLPDRNGIRLDTSHHAGTPTRKENPLTVQFRERFYPDATDEDWDDWRWQSRHRIKTLEQFEKMLDLSFEERDFCPTAAPAADCCHAVLHEPSGSGKSAPGSAKNRRPDNSRIRPHGWRSR